MEEITVEAAAGRYAAESTGLPTAFGIATVGMAYSETTRKFSQREERNIPGDVAPVGTTLSDERVATGASCIAAELDELGFLKASFVLEVLADLEDEE